MKKTYVTMAIAIAFTNTLFAQPDTSVNRGRNQAVAFDVHVPVGEFGKSHILGAGLNYSWSNHRFGQGVSPAKMIGFIATGGVDYYLGKKIEVANYPFTYGGYTNFYVMGGVMCNPGENGNIMLTTGPVFGLYKGGSDVGLGANLFGTYYLKYNIAVGPGITFKTRSETNSLWTGSVRVSYVF